MSHKSVKKGKKESVFNGQVLSSAVITQTVCFVIVVSVAVIGFIQTRRLVYQLGGGAFPLRQSEKYAGGDDAGFSEVPSDAVSDQDSSSVSDDVSSEDPAAGTSQKTTVTTTKRKTARTTRTTKKKTTARKTTASTQKSNSDVTMVKITVSPVNIRSGAGTEFKVIGRTSRGKVYTMLSKGNDSDGKKWYQIAREDGTTGWIMASCGSEVNASTEETTTSAASKKTASTTTATTTAKTASTTATTEKTTKPTKTGSNGAQVKITVSPVNIRSGPGTGYSVIGRTSRGKVFRLVSSRKGSDNRKWCEVALKDGKTGWVMASCCKKTGDSDPEKTTEKTASSTEKDRTSPSTTKKTTAKKTTAKTTTTTIENKDSLLMKLQPDDRSAKYFIVVYIGSQSTAVYKKDSKGNYTKQVKAFTCSTGKKSSPTRTGKYHIRAKYRWRWLVGSVYGQYNSSISEDYLFHSVPYLKKDYSTLEDDEYDKLGRPASKGCIRMCVRDCKWIYDKCDVGTQVRIVSDSGPKGPGVPKRKSDSRYSGWDPSDKWAEDNPYFA